MPKKIAVEQNVSSWLAEIVEKKKFQEHRIIIEDSVSLGGHLGNVICARLVGTTSDNGNEEVCVVVKYNNKQSIEFLKVAFNHEIFIYETLFPTIRQFQLDRNVSEIFSSFPKCLQTIPSGDQVIILENLRKKGYRLHNRLEPMDLLHQKLVLGEYAKLHAVSFAFRDQKYEEFRKLSLNLPNVAKLYFQEESTKEAMMKYTRYARDIMIRRNETELVEKLDWILETGPTEIILNNVLNVNVEDCVVTHGDSWNNNFMFTYKDNGLQPSQLAIIDWQLSSMHSPVLDLSLFIYTVSSEAELFHAEELITFYYSALSDHLRKLGSDPEKIFPVSKLKEHWHKFSIFPVIWVIPFLRIILEEGESEGSREDMFDVSINEEEYEKRMIAVMKHYFSSQLKK